MRVKTFLRTLALALILFACSAAPARADFTFIHCSDIHVGAGENARTDAALLTEIAQLNPKPAFVVATGDICENGTDSQYKVYRDILKNLGDVKMYAAPGNHDIRWNPRGKEGYTRGTDSPLYRSWDYENVHFVTLDSTVLLEHWGHISREQLDWLARDLEKVGPDKPVIIGFHHWIGREVVQVDNDQALLDLVKPYNVVLWLQGHGHADIDWSVNGVPATMVGGLYQGSYDIIEVTADALKISKRALVKPQKKAGELLQQDGEAPPEKIHPLTKPLMTIPLKKRPAPQWSADATLEGDHVRLTASAPAEASVEYRIDTEKPQPLAGLAEIPINKFVPGEHVITVQAAFPEKRAYQHPIMVKIPGAVAPSWEVNIGGEVQSRLVRSGDRLFVSSMGNDLVALDPHSGQEKFRVKTAGPIFSAACVSDGVAYFGSADHNVYAADAASGAIKWKTETGGAVLAGPARARGVVCVGSTDTKIYGLDSQNGQVLWTADGMNMFQSQTATDGEHFFVGGWDNHFRCIDARSGRVNWDLELGRKTAAKNFSPYAPAITAPAVGDGKVFVSTNDGILHALNIDDGKEIWNIDWKRMGYSSPLFHEGRVYGGLSDEGKVFCVDADTGEFKWKADTGSVIYDSSFCFGGEKENGTVFIGCVNGTLSALDADSGQIAWQYRLGPGHLLGSPAADEQNVYMGSMSGKVVALPVRSGPLSP
jgi:outer membrane protein assembly factor BamB